MPIKEREYEVERGKQDAARHREKQKDAIRKGIADIIADTGIITRRKGQIVRIPIRGIKSYHFKHGHTGPGTGVGQGEGEPGDVIGRKPGQGNKPGQAGDQPGIDYIESEIDIEELIEMMLKDLGLPNLEQKELTEVEVAFGWRLRSIDKVGLRPNIDEKRTQKEGVKRLFFYIEELKKLTNRPEEDCETALEIADGDFNEALKMLQDPKFQIKEKKEAAPIITRDDLRFRSLEEDVERYSNAVVLAMMDTSGSMTITKKYLARSFFFWMVEFLRHLYKNVEIRFIAHTTDAKLVDEETFFHKGESGGTLCWTAYALANYLIEKEYSPEKWNIYAFHFSDGEDFDSQRTVQELKKLMAKEINMVGYGEIRVDSFTQSQLMKTFKAELEVEEKKLNELKVISGKTKKVPFLGVVIKGKEDIYPALKEFLKRERWQK